jgi:hypothetical protein
MAKAALFPVDVAKRIFNATCGGAESEFKEHTRPPKKSGTALAKYYRLEYQQNTSNPDRAWHASTHSAIKSEFTADFGSSTVDYVSTYSSSGSELQLVGTTTDRKLYFRDTGVWLVVQNLAANVTTVPSGSGLWKWTASPLFTGASFIGEQTGFTYLSNFTTSFTTILRVTTAGADYQVAWKGKADQITLSGPPGVTDFDVNPIYGWVDLWQISD